MSLLTQSMRQLLRHTTQRATLSGKLVNNSIQRAMT